LGEIPANPAPRLTPMLTALTHPRDLLTDRRFR
jgi:hypothetical protein